MLQGKHINLMQASQVDAIHPGLWLSEYRLVDGHELYYKSSDVEREIGCGHMVDLECEIVTYMVPESVVEVRSLVTSNGIQH